jgi:hypothetical protein
VRVVALGALVGTLLGTLVAIGAWYFYWDIFAPPPIECDVPTAQWCEDTRYASWHDLDGRPSSMRVHAAPPEWAQSIDPAFRAAEWAVTVERYLDSPITAACYYSSDRMVDCEAVERPFVEPAG